MIQTPYPAVEHFFNCYGNPHWVAWSQVAGCTSSCLPPWATASSTHAMPRLMRIALRLACITSPVHRCALLAAAWRAAPTRVLIARSGGQAGCMDRAPQRWAETRPFGDDIAEQRPLIRRERRRRGGGERESEVGVFRTASADSKRQNSRPVSTDELTPGAKARASALVEAYAPIQATEGDLRCIEERQLRHKAGTSVGVSPPCRHGFPQAFAFDPCGYKVSSGLFRLSCPLLVQAIDQLEDEGGIEGVNAKLSTDEDLREDFMAVNLAHAQLRRRLVTADKMLAVKEIIGNEGAERFLDSGITGVTPGKVRDAKCLHAHVADALMRGRGANAIGRATLELLEARGVPVDGGDRCSEQCNYGQEETAESWRYTPQKNKQRLQLRKVRRKGMKPPRKTRGENLDHAESIGVGGSSSSSSGGEELQATAVVEVKASGRGLGQDELPVSVGGTGR